MKKVLLLLAVVSGALSALPGYAQAPAGAPAGATALCKDNTYFSGATKRGACAGHKGIKTWFGGTAAAAAAPAEAAPPAATMAPPAAPSATTGMNRAAPGTRTGTTGMNRGTPAGTTAPAATTSAGGAGQVWVNTDTKVYHCAGDRWYGKTKAGAYMSVSQAEQKGYRPDHGKACR